MKITPVCQHPDGCDLPCASKQYTCKDGRVTTHYRKYCMPHCNRLSRNGDLGPAKIKPKAKNGTGNLSSGYREFYLPSHPLATQNGKVKEHRIVLYEKLGPGTHPCHWCGKELEWGKDLFVDHWDFDKLNNHPNNLLPSCSSCNVKRFNRLVRYILDNGIIDRETLQCV